MARTKRASTRRKSTKRASTRRTSTRRETTRRPSTRRPSARKTTTRRRKPKGLRLTRKQQKQILIVVAVVVGLLIFLALMQKSTYVQKKYYKGEVARNAVYGKVTSINAGPARKAIRVKSLNTGKVYTFYVGWRTRFSPDRWPSPGERVKIYYLYDRGYLKACLLYTSPSPRDRQRSRMPSSA